MLDIEPVFTMCASPPEAAICSRIRGTNAWMPWTTPKTLTPNSHCQSSGVVEAISPTEITPALLHSRWTAPKAS